MDQAYFMIENGNRKGPFTFEQLQAQRITKHTLVWTVGLDNWTKAGSVAALAPLLAEPLPGEEQVANGVLPPIPRLNETDQFYFGYTLATRSERFLAALLEIIITSIPWVLVFGWSSDDDEYFTLMNFGGQALYGLVWGAITYPFFSGNLGHKILGLKVISEVDGKEQNSAVAGAAREAIKAVFSLLFFPAIWLLFDKKKQNLYDKVVKTLVVKKSK